MEQASTLAARDAVVAHLEALLRFVEALHRDTKVDSQLREAIGLWRNATQWEAVGATLAADSCEVVVAVLWLLRGDLGVSASQAADQYASAFLVLACTVRVFEEAHGVPFPGQAVELHGLQSVGAQRLNGQSGTVMRFHPPSGRFIVRLRHEDPPADWKKVRAVNLAPAAMPADANAAQSAVDAARAYGRECLESVADIFDDLMHDMTLEAADSSDESTFADLAIAMWEVLLCCAGDCAMRLGGASLLELCGETAPCSLFARNVLQGHVGFLKSSAWDNSLCDSAERSRRPWRVRSLQESMAHAYCELFQPAAFWREDAEGKGTASPHNDAPMAQLQADFDAHIRRVAEAAVDFGVLPVFIDAVDFHLSWVSTASRPGPLPLALPVLLSRLLCTWLAPTSSVAPAAALCRHIQLQVASLVSVYLCFVTLACTRLSAAGPGSTPSPSELLVSLRAVLDALVALVAVGLWSLGAEVAQQVEGLALTLLDTAMSASDPAILARLVLIFIRQPQSPSGIGARLAVACCQLRVDQVVPLWWHIQARARLRNLEGHVAQQEAQEWLSAAGELPGLEAACAVEESGWEKEVLEGEREVESLIANCLRALPQSLRDTLPEPSAGDSNDQISPTTATGEVGLPPGVAPSANAVEPARSGLSMLDMPALPQQLPNNAVNEARKRRAQKLARADLDRIRGVDPSTAPQDLRCAIDGKVVGNPLRSPYGHLFEHDTLEHWMSMCGSVCPITGQPLRLSDCSEDRAVQKKVVEWAKEAKAQYKERVQERRARRQAQELEADVAHDSALL